MPRRSLEERIEELENRKRSLVARQRKELRAADTRRKVLVGSLMLDRIKGDGEEAVRLRNWLGRELPGFVTRDIDRRVVADLIRGGAEVGAKAGTPGAAEGYAQAETEVGAELGTEADAQDEAEPGMEDGGRNPATLL